MTIRTVDQIEVKGKRVFIRVDFNVPLNEKNEITDDTRIVQSLRRFDQSSKEAGNPFWPPIWEDLKGKGIPNIAWPCGGKVIQIVREKGGAWKRLHWGRGAKTDWRYESRGGASSGESEVSSGRGEE